MKLILASELRQTLLDACAATPTEEVCGLLLGDGNCVTHLLHAPNVAADPARHFEIDPATLIAAHRAARDGGPAILGCWHSHPNGRTDPSATDRAMMLDVGWIWVIVAGEDMTGWRVVAPGVAERIELNSP